MELIMKTVLFKAIFISTLTASIIISPQVNATEINSTKDSTIIPEKYNESKLVALVNEFLGSNDNSVNKELAFKKIQLASNTGNPLPKALLSLMYLEGFGTNINLDKADYWLKQAEHYTLLRNLGINQNIQSFSGVKGNDRTFSKVLNKMNKHNSHVAKSRNLAQHYSSISQANMARSRSR